MVNPAPDIFIFDRPALHKKKRQISGSPDFLNTWTIRELENRLGDINRTFKSALITGRIPVQHASKIEHAFHMDFGASGDLAGEEELAPFKQDCFDLVLSNLTLHNINDLPGALSQIRQSLKPDGLFLAALLGGETLYELRESLMQAELKIKGGTSPRVFPFADKPQMGDLLGRAGFSLPVIDSEILHVSYDNMFSLMHDLRHMGESNIIINRSRTNPGKALFFEAAQYYQNKFGEPGGSIKASFEIIFMIGWTPHESQQKPLSPGSAKTRLADALETEEIKTGDKIL